jgi:lipopolysaccharide/colanic/teichoic acid biosynthesis glycosyltransferase
VNAEAMTSADAAICRECPDLFTGNSRQKFVYLLLKRAMDIVLAPLLLLLCSPILLLGILLITLESKGPPIFVQERVGARYRWKDGRLVWRLCLFRCYKLRSMVDNSDPAIHKEYLWQFRHGQTGAGSASAPFKLTRDMRVTRVGGLLRVMSLDELPQLINVIKGDMSLVGPRPVPLYEVELYDSAHYQRLAALPGITGMWQVYGRSRVTFGEMVQLDIDYARRSSLWLDIKLLLLTVPSVLSLKGAA